MNLEYFDNQKVLHLVEEYFQLSFYKEDIPFTSTILPIGLTHLFYIGTGTQKVVVENVEMPLNGLMVTGQHYRSYKFFANSITSSIGISLHPTALHKLLNIDISKLENRHVPLIQVNEAYHNKLLPIFEGSKNSNELIIKLNSFF
ncbi:DUF6597 domain-containing transcriptional factor [Winogradskyella sp.]|uniref:DUF6597 domain-containing transcriptional factor n=1 Tax=Winogradskyella sp. TaxID=1883156 RepID=UPI0025E50D96|nr:DUF6597 domain-containing transcriptional factor [Winogradskyella sp.]